MKLLRYGPPGQGRPAVLVDGTTAVDVGDALAATFGRADAPFLAYDRSVRLDELADLVARRGPGTREVDLDGVRIGPPARPPREDRVHRPQLRRPRRASRAPGARRADRVHEGVEHGRRARTTTCWIPRGSTKTDWEVELGVVIGGRRAI